LTINDLYRCRTAPLTSKRCILYIYSTNISTEYFKHGIYSPFFFSSSKCNLFHNSNVFSSCIIHILYTECAKIKKNNSGAKRSNFWRRNWILVSELRNFKIELRSLEFAQIFLIRLLVFLAAIIGLPLIK